MRYGKIKIKLKTINNKTTIANCFPFLSSKSVFSWYPKARDKNGTEGEK